MVSDSIPNVSLPMSASNPKDFSKKKRGNRSAKLKQYKLDARREQWLSKVKNNKGGKGESSGGVGENRPQVVQVEKINLEINSNNGDGSMNHYSDSESASYSPTSHTSSVLGGNESGTNFTGTSSSRSSSSSSSGGCFSGNITEEDEDEDGCLDDWEAIADALAATDDKQERSNPSPSADLPPKHDNTNVAQVDSPQQLTYHPASVTSFSKLKAECARMVERCSGNCRAWRPDDTCRPQSLPNLSKQHSFPMNSDRHYGRGENPWDRNNVISAPSSCPICCEDLDFTDSCFLPCPCGFRLCLFCHKRILEQDGRCPGCRKQYEYDPVEGGASMDGGSLTFRLARSCSMITRS